MAIINVIAPMGGGKTLFATAYAVEYSKKYPNRPIYANYNIKLKNVVYTPLLFLPISQISECLIIADDIYASKNLDTLIGIIVNISRKSDIEVIITCQYYTMIPKMIRTLSQIVEVEYVRETDTLYILQKIPVREGFCEENLFKIENAVSNVGNLYDTKQIVTFATASEIENEILKYSHSLRDLELNVNLYTENRTERQRLFKKLSLLKDFTEPPETIKKKTRKPKLE